MFEISHSMHCMKLGNWRNYWNLFLHVEPLLHHLYVETSYSSMVSNRPISYRYIITSMTIKASCIWKIKVVHIVAWLRYGILMRIIWGEYMCGKDVCEQMESGRSRRATFYLTASTFGVMTWVSFHTSAFDQVFISSLVMLCYLNLR